MNSFLSELHRRNPVLSSVAWLHVGLFALTLLALAVDDRQVLGINAWIKPAKFMFSLAVYLGTIAWLSEYVRRPRWVAPSVSVVIAVVIVLESALLLMQAARGTTSHFNTSTAFDGTVFQSMGILIGIDVVMTLVIFVLFFWPSAKLAPAYLWGIRFGFVLFFYGGWLGGQMIGNGAHTFGAPDGGPGLPILDWSTVAGDLRLAHGLGLHALQLLPLIGFAFSRWKGSAGALVQLAAIATVALVYGGVVFALQQQAFRGEPLVSLG